MFLEKLLERNPKLAMAAFRLHEEGRILPDTYVLDLDAIRYNAALIKREADMYGIKLYFMLKQIGRNPLVAADLMALGYDGAVTVDYKEALCMIDNGIRIANVGHLEQIPTAALDRIISSKPDYVTVYSFDMIQKIDETAGKYGILQKLLIRLSDEDSDLYSGQVGGFHTGELKELIAKVKKLEHVKIAGLTVFPAVLYSQDEGEIVPTANMKAMERGRQIAKDCGLEDLNINLPSATCSASLPLLAKLGGKSGEPGHGLTGTTPLHKYSDQPEIPAYIYVSEISHVYDGKSYCYGGGHYRRGHMENVIVGSDFGNMKKSHISAPDDDSIDYHFEIDEPFAVGDCALMAFRTQVFTTRSHVAIVSGIQSDDPKLIGIYSSLGEPIRRNW